MKHAIFTGGTVGVLGVVTKSANVSRSVPDVLSEVRPTRRSVALLRSPSYDPREAPQEFAG